MAARLLLALALAVSIWPFVGSDAARACSCTLTDTKELVAQAEFVVLGTVVQIDEVDDQDPRTLPKFDVKVAVSEYLKGSGPDHIFVQDPSLQSSACSPFDLASVGQQYLLFLNTYQEKDLRTSVCQGSGRVTDTDFWTERVEGVRQISSEQEKPGDTPATIPASNSPSSDTPLLPIAVGTGAVAAALLGGALLFGVRRLSSR